MIGAFFHCPICVCVIDYGCMCPEPQPTGAWVNHYSVDEAKEAVRPATSAEGDAARLALGGPKPTPQGKDT